MGREQELGLLLERWALAQEGEGQVVLLSGEPGIGKSRILTALRGRLEAQGAPLIVTHFGRPLTDVRFVASLLSIPSEDRYGAHTMAPQKHKEETLRTLVDLTEAAARKQPTVLLYEDVQWADPTSLEALDLLIDRVRSFPLLVVLTHRPEFQSRWGAHGHVAGLNLSKLTRVQSSTMVPCWQKGTTGGAGPANPHQDRRGAAVCRVAD